MSEFNGILESLITDGEQMVTEGMTVDSLKNIAKGVAVAAILAGGVAVNIHDHKNKVAMKKLDDEIKAKSQATADARVAYFNSQEYISDCAYINKKYSVNLNEYGFEKMDRITFNKNVNRAILQDLKKMTAKFNSNKKLCNDIADKYIEHFCRMNEEYKDMATKEAEEIRKGPAHAEYYGDDNFLVCDCDQEIVVFMIDYIQKPFCDALNKKYEREIRAGAMNKFSISGDGDEGLIGHR